MNIKLKTIICLVALSSIAATNVVVDRLFFLPAAKVTIRIVDENQKPVEGANIALHFSYPPIKGKTDINGLFTSEGHCNISGIGSDITKDGFYDGAAPIPKFHEQDKVLNRWKPWNKTYTAILRPVIKPVALYARKVQIAVPVLGQPCGYDLETADWVAPYGKCGSNLIMRPNFWKSG